MRTDQDAMARAKQIWGLAVRRAQLRPDGSGADVELTVSGTKGPVYHRLDANGHAVCHTDCVDLERRKDHAR